MAERDPHDRSYDRAYFGFCARDHMPNVAAEDTFQRFLVRCDGCHNGDVRFQIAWDEGEVRGRLHCPRCRRQEAIPKRLLQCEG